MNAPIVCAVVTGDIASSGDISTKGHAPVLALCRALLHAGADPLSPLHVYRGENLCLRIRSIGEGARLTIREGDREPPRVGRWAPFGMAPQSRAVSSGIAQMAVAPIRAAQASPQRASGRTARPSSTRVEAA